MLADVLTAAGIAFLLAVLTSKLYGLTAWWGIIYAAVVLIILLLVHHAWRIKEKAIAQLLDASYPQLEESTGLLLQSPASLNMLETFQYKKTGAALLAIERPLAISKKIRKPVIALASMIAAGSVLMAFLPVVHQHTTVTMNEPAVQTVKKEILLPEVAGIRVSIAPPPYTAKPSRMQQAFNLVVEEGALVAWQVQTSIAAEHVKFIFNDTLRAALSPANADHTQWRIEKKIDSAGFYQVSIDGRISELYKIETIPDNAPVINIQLPRQYTTIDPGEAPQVKINVAVNDDYGVKDAYIAVTIASGNGEAVKFKEQKIALTQFIAGKTQYELQQWLSLPALGMQPGDELYFYIQATDNHQQQSRSDIHIVQLTDTAQLMSLEGLANSLTLKPEFFRSQRQIIIETEQLLKDKDTIGAQAFKDKSNNLGIDQKLLRLRYGKFLGDESSGETEGADTLGDIADFSNAEKVLDAFTDHHDNSEDATYLDPATKKQLRIILNEMWDAELHLRTFTPKDALPFEYKALRLLKELQQKSRVYVAKTNYKTTPLDLKKRLTGDLTRIDGQQLQKDWVLPPNLQQPVREAISLLEKMKEKDNHISSPGVLQQANLRLHEKAMQQPAIYLHAVASMKRILDAQQVAGPVNAADIQIAQQGLQQMLTTPLRLPSATKTHSPQNLSKQYFDNLQNRQP